ncbi:MAG: type II toxin-antitoxin system VapC family toxin [Nitrospirales bacterium]|nr:type II toxin-antitoxin system VapC family toxin [Nitrospirales bacterium]
MPQPKKPRLVDTNVLLRYLVGDEPRQTERATSLMERVEDGSEELDIPPVVVAEMIWTLEKFYEVPRRDIAQKLMTIFSFKGVRGPETSIISTALRSYASTKIDFVDCYLASRANEQNMVLYSFDKKDFSRLKTRWQSP